MDGVAWSISGQSKATHGLGSGYTRTDMCPGLQVFGRVHGQAGEHMEGRVDDVVRVVDSNAGRVGGETGDDGVLELNHWPKGHVGLTHGLSTASHPM